MGRGGAAGRAGLDGPGVLQPQGHPGRRRLHVGHGGADPRPRREGEGATTPATAAGGRDPTGGRRVRSRGNPALDVGATPRLVSHLRGAALRQTPVRRGGLQPGHRPGGARRRRARRPRDRRCLSAGGRPSTVAADRIGRRIGELPEFHHHPRGRTGRQLPTSVLVSADLRGGQVPAAARPAGNRRSRPGGSRADREPAGERRFADSPGGATTSACYLHCSRLSCSHCSRSPVER